MNEFAIRLKELRLEKGLTLVQLAEQAGLNKSSLSRWERVESDCFISQLIILAKFFGVSTDYLLGLED